MTLRPIADTGAIWDALDPAQQRALAVAQLDLLLAIAATASPGRDGFQAEFLVRSCNERLGERFQEAMPLALLAAIRAKNGPFPSLMAEFSRCRICGCTDECACEGGCGWAETNLCTACVVKGTG